MYFSTPEGLKPLGEVQAVEITEEHELDILGEPTVRIVQPQQEFTAEITVSQETMEELRRTMIDAMVKSQIAYMLNNYPNRRVVHLARYGNPKLSKKNWKRIARYYNIKL